MHYLIPFLVTTLQIDLDAEYTIVVQALRLNTLSKLTFYDSQRFDALVKDVFPDVKFQGKVFSFTIGESYNATLGKGAGTVEKGEVHCLKKAFFE